RLATEEEFARVIADAHLNALLEDAYRSTCQCGHDRKTHGMEQPYYCNGLNRAENDNCPCEGFRYRTVQSELRASRDTRAIQASNTNSRALYEKMGGIL